MSDKATKEQLDFVLKALSLGLEMKDLDPQIVKLVNENFWELLDIDNVEQSDK